MHPPHQHKPRLTIGLPTFQGEKYLDECLTNISQQTYRDFIVLVYDNASTDDTWKIVQKFATEDPRFRYFRQNANIGAVLNFKAVLKAADTPLFLWRANDDLWATDYLEKLVTLLDANPKTKLAVAKTISENMDGTNRRIIDYSAFGPGFFSRMRMLRYCHPSWIYGLFERNTLTEIEQQATTKYYDPWALDHLILFYYCFNNLITGTNQTYFQQRYKGGGVKRKKTDEEMNRRQKLRSAFYRVAIGWVRNNIHNWLHEMIWRVFIWFYLGRFVYKARRIYKHKILRAVTTAFTIQKHIP